MVHLMTLAGGDAVAQLEKRASEFMRNPLLTESTRQLIKDLWQAYSDARWVNELLWEQRR
jgi:hypothetical protein